jgi:hypothetical protein
MTWHAWHGTLVFRRNFTTLVTEEYRTYFRKRSPFFSMSASRRDGKPRQRPSTS